MSRRRSACVLLGVVLALFPRPALGETAWTTPAFDTSRAVCSTGNEASNPEANLSATAGVPLGRSPRQGITVSVHSAAARPTAGELHAFLFDFAAGRWSRAPMFDLPVPAGVESFAKVITLAPVPSRIAFLPSGLGTAVTVFASVG